MRQFFRTRLFRTRRRRVTAGAIMVMAISLLLLSVAVPYYTLGIHRSKETILKQNLFTLRTVIDEYTFDKKAAPQQLEDLVAAGYLRDVPVDPFTGSKQTWVVVRGDSGIRDVHSLASGTGPDGTHYNQW